jgi:hypothetical protein
MGKEAWAQIIDRGISERENLFMIASLVPLNMGNCKGKS